MQNKTIILIINILISISLNLFSQGNSSEKNDVDTAFYQNKADSIYNLYEYKNSIPDNIKISFCYALAHYPELMNNKVIFKEKRIKTTLSARPTVLSVLFRKKENRKYIIRINNNPNSNAVLLKHIPKIPRAGLFGHEFAHFSDYESKKALKMFICMINYIIPKKKNIMKNLLTA